MTKDNITYFLIKYSQTTNNKQPTTNNQQQMTNDHRKTLLKLAAKVLQDSSLKRKVSNRVYELIEKDLRKQRERSRNY
ncbi:MAG TPA: hypothetical protein DD379_13360 [Cyanobacteria bacterium UBA11162]|nr:hypothetical protein [Cyanobacteria bacterium UBA11162]